MRIAGDRDDKDWLALKDKLRSKPSPGLWNSAFQEFYRTRIDTRYLDPIASIHQHDTKHGEGFAIAALFCSLIEFLESCERGHNFHFVDNAKLQPHEYNQASQYFKDFLRTRHPFNKLVPRTLVNSFYTDVRCGLLHEARTKGGWIISTKPSSALILQNGSQITLFRNRLIPALKEYFLDYQKRLLANHETQEAFIRKFDHLCKP